MPDFSLCANTSCPLRFACKRANTPPSEYRQAYTYFHPNIQWEQDNLKGFYCEGYKGLDFGESQKAGELINVNPPSPGK